MNNYKCLTMVILGKRQANYRETTSLTNNIRDGSTDGYN